MTTSTKRPPVDQDLFRKELKKLRATRGNTVDDVNDLPDSLPLGEGRTTVMFFDSGKKPRPKK